MYLEDDHYLLKLHLISYFYTWWCYMDVALSHKPSNTTGSVLDSNAKSV